MDNYLAHIAVQFFLTHPFAAVAVTSGSDDSLDEIWGGVVSEVEDHFCDYRVREKVVVEENEIYMSGNQYLWSIYRIPYLKGKSEKFAGCFAKHSLIIIADAALVEDSVLQVGRTYTMEVIVNGPNV